MNHILAGGSYTLRLNAWVCGPVDIPPSLPPSLQVSCKQLQKSLHKPRGLQPQVLTPPHACAQGKSRLLAGSKTRHTHSNKATSKSRDLFSLSVCVCLSLCPSVCLSVCPSVCVCPCVPRGQRWLLTPILQPAHGIELIKTPSPRP